VLLLLDGDYRESRRALARALVARGDDVIVMSTPEGPLDHGVTAIPWHIDRGGLDPLREARALAEVVSAYARLRPDLVHHVALKPAVHGGIAAALAGIPSVTTITGLGYLGTGDAGAVARDRRLFRAVLGALRVVSRRERTRVIFQNHDDLARLVGLEVVDPARARVVRGSGVDLARFAPREPAAGPPIVLFAGRLLREKGIVEFCEAAAELGARGVAARFVVVGAPDPHNPGSLSAADLARWRGSVELWGRREDMPEVIGSATVVCVPSWREGVAKVLLEAAACARAIVTTDAPGCREVVRDRVEGLVVPARDPAALARAIAGLLADAALRRELGRRARARVAAEFSAAHVVAQTLAVYDELVPVGSPIAHAPEAATTGPGRARAHRALFAANAAARRLIYRSPRATALIWGARVERHGATSFWELGSLAIRRTLRRELRDGLRALEIGTGPHALVAVWAARRWRLDLVATDIDPAVADAAARTASANRARIDIRCSDLFGQITGRFDAIWFVPPFTPAATFAAQGGELADPSARWRTCGGERGWETIDRFLDGVDDHLTPAGRAYFVVNTVHQPVATMRALVARHGMAIAREDRLPWLPYVTFVVVPRAGAG
jgi:glycosyltransferase involved in cell wall biosynthesis